MSHLSPPSTSSSIEQITQKTILFLTTDEYSLAPSISDPYSTPANIASLPVQNRGLAESLCLAGADVRFSSWKFPAAASTRATLCRFDIIVFLCCDGYARHIDEFLRFLDNTLIPLKEALPRLRILNDPAVVRWCASKEHLRELREGGFRIFRTQVFSHAGLEELRSTVREFAASSAITTTTTTSRKKKPVLLKSSVGASAAGLHVIQDPESLTEQDLHRMEEMLRLLPAATVGSVMIQEFQPTMRTIGEYSLVYIGGVYSHAVLKAPKAAGAEWRVSGKEKEEEEVAEQDLPKGATEVGQRLCAWLEKRFGKGSVVYMRLDGVVAEDDSGFVVGEIQLTEPEIWLTGGDGQKRVERFVECLLA